MRSMAAALVVLLTLTAAGCAGSQKQSNTAAAGPLDTAELSGTDGQKLEHAVQQMDADKLDESIAEIEELRKRHPNNLTVLHELALAQRRAQRPEKAIEILWPYRDSLPV